MLNGCSVLVARKLLQSVTNEPDELTHPEFPFESEAKGDSLIGVR